MLLHLKESEKLRIGESNGLCKGIPETSRGVAG